MAERKTKKNEELEPETPDGTEAPVPEAEEAPEPSEAEAVAEEEPGDESEPASAAEAPEPSEDSEPSAPARPRKTRAERKARSERRSRVKARARAQGGERKPIVRTPKPERARRKPKERRGLVVSSAMDKTIVVRVDSLRPHRTYKKVVRRSQKLHVHDEKNAANVGDVVRIVATRPLSKTKHWRLVEVVEVAR